MRFKKLLGAAASGALVAGTVAALASPAQAATSATYDVTYSCSGFGQTVPFETKAEVATSALGPVANKVDVQLGNFPGIIPVALADRNWAVATTVADATGDIALNGTHAQSVAASTPAPLPVATGNIARQVDAAAVTFGALKVTITKVDGTGNPTVMNCSLTKQALVPAVPEGHIAFDCNGQWGPMVYTTTIEPTVKRVGQSVTIGFQPSDLAGIVPATVITDMAVEVGMLVNDVAVTATGSASTQITANEPIKLPAVSASVATTATQINVVVTSMKIVVPTFKMEFPCTLAAPAEIGSYTVDAAPVVVTAAGTKSVTKVAYNKKKKTAVVTTTVKAGKKNAAGKVTVLVKKGKKVVSKKTLTLKNGKVTLKLSKKQLKAKGVYTVTANYAGAKAFKKSAAKKVTFRVK